MKIAHVALWTRNLDAQLHFWQSVFGGKANDRYHSQNRPGFASHFITLSEGPTIELMTAPDLPDAPPYPEFICWAHIALSVGTKADVDRMAEQARLNGALVRPPRLTGDGYYEAVMVDPDGNHIELLGE